MSLARRHRNRMMQQAAAAKADTSRVAPMPDKGPQASAYETIMVRLHNDQRTLHDIQSIEGKIAKKRELIGGYVEHVKGALDAAKNIGKAVQDEVVVTMMIWAIDIGAFDMALHIAEHVLEYKLELPARYERTTGCLIAEEIAEAAYLSRKQNESFDLVYLQQAEILTEKQDMPDQARAKLYREIGFLQSLRGDTTETDSDGPAGGKRAAYEYSLAALRRALALHDKCGVKKEIERVERELGKLAPAVPAS